MSELSSSQSRFGSTANFEPRFYCTAGCISECQCEKYSEMLLVCSKYCTVYFWDTILLHCIALFTLQYLSDSFSYKFLCRLRMHYIKVTLTHKCINNYCVIQKYNRHSSVAGHSEWWVLKVYFEYWIIKYYVLKSKLYEHFGIFGI